MSNYECINVQENDDISIVKLIDEKVMDPERVQKLGTELLSLPNGETERILINMENVRFLSSAAINKLIVLEKRMRGNGGQVKLSNLCPEVREVFSITNLTSVFDIREEQDEALEAFGSGE